MKPVQKHRALADVTGLLDLLKCLNRKGETYFAEMTGSISLGRLLEYGCGRKGRPRPFYVASVKPWLISCGPDNRAVSGFEAALSAYFAGFFAFRQNYRLTPQSQIHQDIYISLTFLHPVLIILVSGGLFEQLSKKAWVYSSRYAYRLCVNCKTAMAC